MKEKYLKKYKKANEAFSIVDNSLQNVVRISRLIKSIDILEEIVELERVASTDVLISRTQSLLAESSLEEARKKIAQLRARESSIRAANAQYQVLFTTESLQNVITEFSSGSTDIPRQI